MLGEIFLCQFPFMSGASGKIRPALVLFDLHSDVIICRVTSIDHTGPLDVRLKDWPSAGLLKPSVARVDSNRYRGKDNLPEAAGSFERFRQGSSPKHLESEYEVVKR